MAIYFLKFACFARNVTGFGKNLTVKRLKLDCFCVENLTNFDCFLLLHIDT